MGSTFEMVIVAVVVIVALAWAGRAAWRSVRKQGVCSSCGSSGDCPVAGNPQALAELERTGNLPPATDCQEFAEVLENGSPTEKSPTSSS